MQNTLKLQFVRMAQLVCGICLSLGLLVSLGPKAHAQVLFEDNFSITGPGPGAGWSAAPQFPNIVNERRPIAGRDVYEIASQSPSNETFGIQRAVSIVGVSQIQIDLNAAIIMAGATNAGVILQLGTDSTTYGSRIVFQNWRTGILVDGRGDGGAFSNSSADGAFSFFEYYTARISIDGTGTTLSLLSDNAGSVLYSYTNTALKFSDLPGSINLAILQVAGPGTAIADVYVDKVAVAVPEPSTYAMMLSALGIVVVMAKKRRLQPARA